MNRKNLLSSLSRYQSQWPEEGVTVRRFIDFVEQHNACFERSHQTGHVTGSAWVVNHAGTHVLLTHHRKLNKWLQLGGHADGQSNILEVALREAEEESGLDQLTPVSEEIFDIDVHLIPARKSDPAHDHFDVRFAFQACGSEEYAVSDESHDLAWVKIERLKDYTTEASMIRMAKKWIDRTPGIGV